MNIANRKREEETPCCYFHPKQAVIGVCPLCLNERLLIVAAKQGHHHHHHHSSTASHQIRLQSSTHRKQPSSASIHKIFAFGSLFSRPESQQLKSHNYDYDASPSPEDSFISIKFEENGVASWEKNTVSSSNNKVCVESRSNNKKMLWNHQNLQILNNNNNNNNKESKSVIEHRKSNNTFRWRKRLGRLFHLIQWKRSTKVGSKVEGVKKVRKGWMRTLTKRKTVE